MAVVDLRKSITRNNSVGKGTGGDRFGRGGGGGGEGDKGVANHSGIGEFLGGVGFLGGVDLGGGGQEVAFGLVLLLGDGTLGEARNLTGERFSLHLRACLGHVVSRIVLNHLGTTLPNFNENNFFSLKLEEMSSRGDFIRAYLEYLWGRIHEN